MPRMHCFHACRIAGSLVLSVSSVVMTTAVASAAVSTRIEILDDKGMAPFAVHVNALRSDFGNNDDALTVRYDWNFGDSDDQYNTLPGWNAAHIYDSPGTYTIKLRVTDQNGKQTVDSTHVTVTAAKRKMIYVAGNGDDSNPGTQDRPIRSASKASQLMNKGNAAVLFKRGGTYDVSNPIEVEDPNILLSAYGSGSTPVLNWTGGDGVLAIMEFNAAARDVVIQNLAFSSPNPQPTLSTGRAIHPAGKNLTVRKCRFDNISFAMNCEQDVQGLLAVKNDCGLIGAYFSWAEGSDHTYIGNTCEGSRSQHVIRFGGLDRCLIYDNTITNHTNSTIWAMLGSYVYIDNNVLDGGRCIVGPNRSVGSPDDRFPWAVIENNHISNEGLGAESGAEHVMMRNNIIERDADSAITIGGYYQPMNRSNTDVRICNNTATNNDTTGRFINIGAQVNDLLVANNMYVAPHLHTGTNMTANVFMLDDSLAQAQFSNNIWAIPEEVGWGNGWNYLFSYWSDVNGYKSRGEWNSMSQTSQEHYRNFKSGDLDNQYRPTFSADSGVSVPGVQEDCTGAGRGKKVTVGAMNSRK
jgi:PKD repeat protein